MFDIGSRQEITDIDSKRATTKCTDTALYCQPCKVSCLYLMSEQRQDVTVELKDLYTSWTRVTRFTASGSNGSQQSTDVSLTTPVWQSSMITSDHTSTVLY